MRLRTIFKIITICCFCFGAMFAQIRNEPVAKIGTSSINEEEFIERYELTPVFGKHKKGMITENKLKFLYTLIAEKLWALEATEARLDTTEAMKTVNEAFRKMFVRDFLYHQEIRNKVKVTEEDILTGYKRNAAKLYVNYLISEDEEEIKNLYSFLMKGVPFDTILAESPEADEQKVPMEIVYGQMDEEIEDILYRLKKSEFSEPLLTPDGWYIFRLTNRTDNLMADPNERDDSYRTVEKVVTARKEQKIYYEFYAKYFKNVKIETDAVLLKSLTVKIADALSTKKFNRKLKEGEKIYLEQMEIADILNSYSSDTLSGIVIKFSEEPVNLHKFILLLGFDGFSVTATDLNSVFRRLNSKTRSFIEKELIAREGLRRGYQNEESVRNSLKMWQDNYLYQMIQSRVTDTVSVSEDEVREYYNSYSKEYTYPTSINLIEIYSDSLSVIKRVLDELETGADFKELARRYNERKGTLEKGGEHGMTPIMKLGELGIIAGRLGIGDIFGPIKIDSGYSVIKVTDRIEASYLEDKQPYEKMKDKLGMELKTAKIKNYLINETSRLAMKYGIEINSEVFNGIKTTGLNSLGMRFLGFGGRITAAPLLPVFDDWVEEYFRQKNQIP